MAEAKNVSILESKNQFFRAHFYQPHEEFFDIQSHWMVSYFHNTVEHGDSKPFNSKLHGDSKQSSAYQSIVIVLWQ